MFSSAFRVDRKVIYRHKNVDVQVCMFMFPRYDQIKYNYMVVNDIMGYARLFCLSEASKALNMQ